MSKPTENDVHLWIEDMLPTIYEAAFMIFRYSKKGEVPYGRQSLISMQKLYMIIGYGASISNTWEGRPLNHPEARNPISTDNTPT